MKEIYNLHILGAKLYGGELIINHVCIFLIQLSSLHSVQPGTQN